MTNYHKQLCLALMHAEDEEEIVGLLRDAGYWDDPSAWRLFGDFENNFSQIGNQQRDAVAALVEKIINATDARLIGECRARGIDPEGEDAPNSSAEAVALFFEQRSHFRPDIDGRIADWTDSKILAQARLLTVTATGKGASGDPSITVSDAGEGQAPDRFPDTFLSLNKSNKLRIPFVQGKFNMGGTGALQFCGTKHNFQLIVSRRRPDLLDSSSSQRDHEWGFTIIRRRAPEEGARSSVYEYLAPTDHQAVLSFAAQALPIFPREGTGPYEVDSEFGTLVKMYAYRDLGTRASVTGRRGLLRRIEMMLPRAILPVRIVETRYERRIRGESAFGVENRLDRERERVLEEGFPRTGAISVNGTRLAVSVYVFRPEKISDYRPTDRHALSFLVNGQTHASRGTTFYKRKSVRRGYLAPDMLTTVDCTDLPAVVREDLFLNSRDRMRFGALQEDIEMELARFLREDERLTQLNQQRRDAVHRDPRENAAAVQAVKELLTQDASLRRLLLEGGTIGPVPPPNQGEVEFEGKQFPSFFELVRPRSRNGTASTQWHMVLASCLNSGQMPRTATSVGRSTEASSEFSLKAAKTSQVSSDTGAPQVASFVFGQHLHG